MYLPACRAVNNATVSPLKMHALDHCRKTPGMLNNHHPKGPTRLFSNQVEQVILRQCPNLGGAEGIPTPSDCPIPALNVGHDMIFEVLFEQASVALIAKVDGVTRIWKAVL